MKHFLTVCAVCSLNVSLFSIANAAGLTVTVPTYPNATVGVSKTYHGTLTEVATDTNIDIAATSGPSVGNYTAGTISFSGSIATHEEDCCTSEDTPGKKVIVDESDTITVTTTFSTPTKNLPAWAEFSSQCSTAKAEWTRFRNKVVAHENDHEQIAKDFYTQTNVRSYFDASEMFYEETDCLPTNEVAAMKTDISDRFLDTLLSVESLLKDEEQEAQDAYHSSPENEFTTIDITQECS